jgi:hypothetical protein
MRTGCGLLAVAALAIGGCGASIHSTVAPNANLARYRTYAFYTPPYKEGQAETIADQTIRSSLRQDLAEKGLTESTTTEPDFLVTYHVMTHQQLDVAAVGYGFWGWPGAAVTSYTEGTLVVDFIDPKTRQVFWRGTATGVVNHPQSPNLAKLDKVVSQVVDRYPTTM